MSFTVSTYADAKTQVIDRYDQTECSICCVAYETQEKVAKLACDHIFHEDCFAEFRKDHEGCPFRCFSFPTITTEKDFELLGIDIHHLLDSNTGLISTDKKMRDKVIERRIEDIRENFFPSIIKEYIEDKSNRKTLQELFEEIEERYEEHLKNPEIINPSEIHKKEQVMAYIHKAYRLLQDPRAEEIDRLATLNIVHFHEDQLAKSSLPFRVMYALGRLLTNPYKEVVDAKSLDDRSVTAIREESFPHMKQAGFVSRCACILFFSSLACIVASRNFAADMRSGDKPNLANYAWALSMQTVLFLTITMVTSMVGSELCYPRPVPRK